ncbi:FHA domain-containing serine/threonine-protein kinase [Chondromyces apiculatus]|uniref:FHA domain-containing serine/threonine-protein kinase n=1 Tax=Chondromyces apiculatus TaxID=51 RepID=UPI001E58180D|nr:FHA domain-containing serine/threonine-protein kinase [Chondromyces apiculatus]
MTKEPLPPITVGTIINDRYEVQKHIGKGGMGEVFLSYDRSTQQPVALKLVPESQRMPGDDEALRQEVILAQKARHPNVCRVFDLAPSLWGPIIVMEYIPGQTLHHVIRRRRQSAGFNAEEFRKIATDICAGLAAIHREDLVHGDLKPGNVMVSDDRAVILDFGFAQERARTAARRPGSPPDGGTPHYMSPERLRDGGSSPDDDVYALALTLWEMWTCRVPEPGSRPRARPMRQQIVFDVPAMLTHDEIRQIFRALNEDPAMRPQARHMRFFSPPQTSTIPLNLYREHLNPGPTPGIASSQHFTPGAQALLITYATNAPEIVGSLVPLERPELTLGRRSDQELRLGEPTVSSVHAILRWQAGSWIIEDQGSTNGTYADYPFERRRQLSLRHASDVQVGECRMKLVSFKPESPHHQRARRYLAKRDGLTELFVREHLMKAIDEDGLYAEWAEAPMQVAVFQLRGANRQVNERPTILEMLALRRAAQGAVEKIEAQLLSLVPLTAGRTGPLRFAVAMVGVSQEEARQVLEQVLPQVQDSLPKTLELIATLVKLEPGRPARSLLG